MRRLRTRDESTFGAVEGCEHPDSYSLVRFYNDQSRKLDYAAEGSTPYSDEKVIGI
jgi:hypothetical protein